MMKKSQVPAFGSWEYNDDDMPFTECFESARQAGLKIRYSYTEDEDRDLYVAGDLYQNDVVTPAMIVVPRQRAAKARYPHVKEGKKERGGTWAVCDYDVKEPPSPPPMAQPPPPTRKKAVDEDLYKISPNDLLYATSKRKRRFGLFSCCLLP